MIHLQDYEGGLEPELPEGRTMVDAWLARLFERCAKMSGKVLVGEVDGRVAGFVGVFGRVPPEEPW